MGTQICSQLKLLLWKNFTLKKRSPIRFTVELLLPLALLIILVLVRTKDLKYRYDRCYLHEKYQASTNLLLFGRDYVCFFNTSCVIETEIDWKPTNFVNEFGILIKNMSDVIESMENYSYKLNDILNWIKSNPNEVVKLQYSIAYINNTSPSMRKFMSALAKVMNGTATPDDVKTVTSTICGTEKNDLTSLIEIFLYNNSSRPKRSFINDCHGTIEDAFDDNEISRQLYGYFSPILWGKIYYSPNSNFTREIVRRANESFVALDNLRKAAMAWRTGYRNNLQYRMMNSSSAIDLRESLAKCGQIPNPYRNSCMEMHIMLSPTNIFETLNGFSFVFSIVETLLDCVLLDKFRPAPSAAYINNFTFKKSDEALAGVVFDESTSMSIDNPPKLLNLSIRVSSDRIDSTLNFKVLDKFWSPNPRITTVYDNKYYASGFSLVQELLSEAYGELLSGRKYNAHSPNFNGTHYQVGASVQFMPYPCYVKDNFIRFLSDIMPLLLLITWTSSFTRLIESIVYEKQHRLKEFMRVMGLSNFVHWLGWFISTMIILTITSIVMVFLIKICNILEFSNPMVVFIFLFSYTVSIVCQAFMISVFFNTANVAGVAGGILYFMLYLPYVVVMQKQDQLGASFYYGVSLVTQIAFCKGVSIIVEWEQTGQGVSFSNFYSSTTLNLEFGLGHSIMMMWLDSFLYLTVTWYVEAVFPGQYGVPRPWYFPITCSYWCENRPKSHDAKRVTPSDSPIFTNVSNEDKKFQMLQDVQVPVEDEPIHLPIGISIVNLTKVYDAPYLKCSPKLCCKPNDTNKAVVDSLSLNFYEGQITAFLGHNGAGKTTTISILTGMIPVTSGTAYINGLDIRDDVDQIRGLTGLCPQHNILFDTLTVEDHVYFYGMLKGMTQAEVEEVLPTIIEDVGLSKKRNVESRRLSGGMKRKLSIAMAFVGETKVVFLDEPTAGVDPFARRSIWELLLKYKREDRTIILTTHHMDEADFLSDRIAVISAGKLCCCGSSVFLKRVYGEGYYLYLEKGLEKTEQLLKGPREIKSDRQLMLNFIQKYIVNARIIEDTRSGWIVLLPNNDDGTVHDNMSRLLKELDYMLNNHKLKNVISYGISDTTLEEVFLKVAGVDSNRLLDSDESSTMKTSFDNDGDIPVALGGRSSRINSRQFSQEIQKNVYHDADSFNSNNNTSNVGLDNRNDVYLVTGFILFWQQIWGLLLKRWHYSKRNVKGLFVELVLPVLMVLIMLIIMKVGSQSYIEEQPAMPIHPWLMMPRDYLSKLITFYRRETNFNQNEAMSQSLEKQYRTSLGEGGLRCMSDDGNKIHKLTDIPVCYSATSKILRGWSPVPTKQPIPLQSPSCDCKTTGLPNCPPDAGGPLPLSSSRLRTSDQLANLTGYNISDHLIKSFYKYKQRLYGGFQFLLPNNFGRSALTLASSDPIWKILSGPPNTSSSNTLFFLKNTKNFVMNGAKKTVLVRIWANSKGYASVPAYLNIWDNLILRYYLKNSSTTPPEIARNVDKYGILVYSHPFKYNTDNQMQKLQRLLAIKMMMALFTLFSLSLIPASFIIFQVEERASNSKRQQLVSGVNPLVYWFGMFLWDVLKFSMSVSVIIGLYAGFGFNSNIGEKNVEAFVCLLFIYIFSIIPHIYPFSFLFSIPSTAFVVMYLYNILVGTIATMATYILELLEDTEKSLKEINDVLKKLFLIFPQYCLGRGMIDLSSSYMKYNISNGEMDYDPFEWKSTGEKICAMLLVGVFWTFVMIIIETRILENRLRRKMDNINLNNTEDDEEDEDVTIEREIVRNKDPSQLALRVENLVKIYGKGFPCQSKQRVSKCGCICCKSSSNSEYDSNTRKMAVNNLTFGVMEGECFGLLGINGAGKTTTFKMLTGEEYITQGTAHISGYSVLNQIMQAHKNLGFCPQFDALHSLLSVEEELWLYCLLRGIPYAGIPKVVERSMRNLNLDIHRGKITSSLSGGNKRKLSTAIALIGSPKVIFLDEPTAGMDAGARRFLWNRIQKLTSGRRPRTVILTSHNMEECEVLCHRLSIMVDGRMKCIGSVQHLKTRFGSDYQIHIHLLKTSDIGVVKKLLQDDFKRQLLLQDEGYISLLYRFDPKTVPLSDVFQVMNMLKQDRHLIVDFSISQTTLDEIFVNFAKERRVSRLLSASLRRQDSSSSRDPSVAAEGTRRKGLDNKSGKNKHNSLSDSNAGGVNNPIYTDLPPPTSLSHDL